jgi:hypothetical protein
MNDGANVAPSTDGRYLFRPPQSLLDLPVEYRWEVVRRHPYYLAHWSWGHRRYACGPMSDLEGVLAESAVVVLLNIGVSDDPPPPGTSFQELRGGQLGAAWENGAVAPVTFRGLVMAMVKDLPPDARRLVGQTLLDSAAADTVGDNDGQARAKFDAVLRLMRSDAPGLSAVPDRPIFGVNVYAPQRAVVEAVERTVREWKEREGQPERRRRDDLLGLYLDVWDRREGWVADGYDAGRERTFRQIASDLKLPSRTAANRYAAAFEMVTGHPYTIGNWVRVFATEKLDGAYAVQSLRRRRVVVPDPAGRSVDAVDETTLAGGRDVRDGGLLAREASDAGSQAYGIDLLLDVADLTEQGLDEDAIAEKLELRPLEAGRLLVRTILDRHRERTT